MDECGDFVVFGWCEIGLVEEFFEVGMEDGDRGFELVGSVGGEMCGVLEFFVGVFEGGFGVLVLDEVFVGVVCEFFDGIGKV